MQVKHTPFASLALRAVCCDSSFKDMTLSVLGSSFVASYHSPLLYGERIALIRRIRTGSLVRSILGPMRARFPSRECHQAEDA